MGGKTMKRYIFPALTLINCFLLAIAFVFIANIYSNTADSLDKDSFEDINQESSAATIDALSTSATLWNRADLTGEQIETAVVATLESKGVGAIPPGDAPLDEPTLEADSIWDVRIVQIETNNDEYGWLNYEVHLALKNNSTEFQEAPRFKSGLVETQEGKAYAIERISIGFLWTIPIPPGLWLRGRAGEFEANFKVPDGEHPTLIYLGEMGPYDLEDIPPLAFSPLNDDSASFSQLPTVYSIPNMVQISLSDITFDTATIPSYTVEYKNLGERYQEYSGCTLSPRYLVGSTGFVSDLDFESGLRKDLTIGEVQKIQYSGQPVSTERILALVENNCINPPLWTVFETSSWRE
jgi:hypothetical protein